MLFRTLRPRKRGALDKLCGYPLFIVACLVDNIGSMPSHRRSGILLIVTEFIRHFPILIINLFHLNSLSVSRSSPPSSFSRSNFILIGFIISHHSTCSIFRLDLFSFLYIRILASCVSFNLVPPIRSFLLLSFVSQ